MERSCKLDGVPTQLLRKNPKIFQSLLFLHRGGRSTYFLPHTLRLCQFLPACYSFVNEIYSSSPQHGCQPVCYHSWNILFDNYRLLSNRLHKFDSFLRSLFARFLSRNNLDEYGCTVIHLSGCLLAAFCISDILSPEVVVARVVSDFENSSIFLKEVFLYFVTLKSGLLNVFGIFNCNLEIF